MKAKRMLSRFVLTVGILGVLASSGVSLAQDRVITIYFCGTGATSEWYRPEVSKWHTPELIASLYQNDNSYPITKTRVIDGIVEQIETAPGHQHYKYIVDGMGTHELIEKIDPDLGTRNWDKVVDEALSAVWLAIVKNEPDQHFIVNLVGWSRGGILTMKTARRLAGAPMISKVNILAYDPVHGGFGQVALSPADFQLPALVNQYVGIYALDERSYMFEPMIPDTRLIRKSWCVSVPGSHETMMGNLQFDGHALPLEFDLDHSRVDDMLPVSRVALAIAQQLLTSWEWGEVPQKAMAPENSESEFLRAVDAMYQYDYW